MSSDEASSSPAAPLTYLAVHNAHNGESTRIPKPIRFHTLNAFKNHLLESFTSYVAADINNIFLLTSFGIKLNFNLINELSDVYVFDKRLFSPDYNTSILASYISQNEVELDRLKPIPSQVLQHTSQPAPDNIKKMTSNLKINESWSKATLKDCYAIEEHIKLIIRQVNTIFKSLNIIFQFGTNFVNGIEKNFNNFFNFIKLLNMKTLHKNWSEFYKTLKHFPSFTFKSHGDDQITLSSYLKVDTLKDRSNFIAEKLPLVVNKFNEMSTSLNKVNDDKLNIDSKIGDLRNESISIFKDHDKSNHSYLNETILLVQDLSKDIEKLVSNNLTALQDSYNDHRDRKTPQIYSSAMKLFKFLEQSYSFKLKLIEESLSIFQTVANLQMRAVYVKSDLKALTSPQPQKDSADTSVTYETINEIKTAEDYLSLTIDLPLLFGFIIIENRRHFEWSDFYSKGIVNSISEQLSIIIDHERSFQTLWWKKFSGFINLITDEEQSVLLPTIDVTLLNNKRPRLLGYKLEREDILKYIAILKQYNSASSGKFAEILEKNFKDLVVSTDNMQKVTRISATLASYTSLNNDNSDSSKLKNETDVDFDIVKGLENRIKKLENLLHQQQYKNISNWPVVKSLDNKPDNSKMSMILDSGANIARQTNSGHHRVGSSPSTTTSAKNNPTSLLQRRHTSSTSTSNTESSRNEDSKVLDASTTIDKHLDNIRLKRENKELLEKNSRLSQQNQSKDELVKHLREEIFRLKTDESKSKGDFENALSEKEQELKLTKQKCSSDMEDIRESKNREVEKAKGEISECDKRIKVLQSELESKAYSLEEVKILRSDIESLTVQLKDANNMKGDLLSNMSSKEMEFTKERNNLENEIKSLRSKLEELTEDYENLMELTQAKHKHNEWFIEELNSIIVDLFKRISILAVNNYEFFLEFCYVLECMGLLLVKHFDETTKSDKYKIIRVKGLKSKKTSDIQDNGVNESSLVHPDTKLNSKIPDEVARMLQWSEKISNPELARIDETAAVKSVYTTESSDREDDLQTEETSKSAEQSAKLISIYNDVFTNSPHSFDQFVDNVTFKEGTILRSQESDDDIINQKFFLNAISKRFRDVEGFAKKLTKENKAKIQELNKIIDQRNDKIAINNFQVGDLLLFLPTRFDRDIELPGAFDDDLQPWAAFNIGAPHYFLKTKGDISDREWLVCRVSEIIEHKVSHENMNDKEANPYQLSAGVTWYMVDASEEK